MSSVKQAVCRVAASTHCPEAFLRDAVALRFVRREFGKHKRIDIIYTTAAVMDDPQALADLLVNQGIPFDATIDQTTDYRDALERALGRFAP